MKAHSRNFKPTDNPKTKKREYVYFEFKDMSLHTVIERSTARYVFLQMFFNFTYPFSLSGS